MVDQRFNMGVEGARQDGFGSMLTGFGGDAARSVGLPGGVTF